MNENEVILRDWQEQAKSAALEHFYAASLDSPAALIQANPGAGKTILGLSIADQLFQKQTCTHIVVVAPRTELISQWQADAAKHYNIQLKDGMLYRDKSDFGEYQGIVMTYSGMHSATEELRIFTGHHKVLVVADEPHHLRDQASWGRSFQNAFEITPYRLMLTGTPWTSDGTRMPFVEYDDDGYVHRHYSYTKKEAIRDDVCRAVEFFSMKNSNLEFNRQGDITRYDSLEHALKAGEPGAFDKAMGSVKHLSQLFKEADDRLTKVRNRNGGTAGGLIIAKDIDTAHAFQRQIFVDTGVEYPMVHSSASKASERIDKFRNSRERWLIAVDMVSEGVDIKRLQVCIFLHTSRTELFLRQVVGRIERRRADLKNVDMDETAFFFYTKCKELDELIDKLREENVAGIALREERLAMELEQGVTSRRERKADESFLQRIDTEYGELVANGERYDKEIVAEALALQSASSGLWDVPVKYLCKVILAKNSIGGEPPPPPIEPISVKKKRLRSSITSELTSRLGKALNRKPTGAEVRNAHYRINGYVGIYTTNDDTSLEDLERKLEFISDSRPLSWLS